MCATGLRKLSIVIPAYNEAATIAETVARVQAVDVAPLELEVIVVDDGSTDRTREVLRAIPGIQVLVHERNRGKGGAVKTAFRAATGDILLIQDGYKAFTKRLIDSLPIEAEGFEYDNELICKLLRRGHRIEEVPISYYRPRTYEEGKKITWIDGMRMIWTIVKWRFGRF